ncbi:DUF115 domain-containing protein [Leptolyngbya sp. 15MV]|nr:DUF115 domain-containing protein [Leptolyngbya sp. 15MV]
MTALDYHAVSRRFYEGLSASDVEGVTLVVDPKANPAILEAWPWAIRCPGDGLLDSVLGPGLRTGPHQGRGRGGSADTLKPGATVSHLAYYLARHLGCDPVVLVGQDLGFTDGQYYSAGAAIHAIWGAELGPFRSLEAFEWERIARHRTHLHRVTDQLGRAMYTDEQMITYHVQFERDFAEATLAGLTTVDATEGGVMKRHTLAMPLAEALETFAGDRRAPELDTPVASPAARREIIRRVTARAQEIARQVGRVARQCDTTAGLLREMLEHHAEQARVNTLIARVHRIRDEVAKEEPAFTLVQFLNQTGTLRRVRADRALALDRTLAPLQRQRGQIERDIQNVTWLGDAARELAGMLEHSIAAYQGGPRHTDETDAGPESALLDGQSVTARKRVAAMVPVDPTRGGLGTARDLGAPVLAGMGALELLLVRLARSRELDLVVLLAEDAAGALRLAGRGAAALGPRLGVRSPAGPRFRSGVAMLDSRKANAVAPARTKCGQQLWHHTHPLSFGCGIVNVDTAVRWIARPRRWTRRWPGRRERCWGERP